MTSLKSLGPDTVPYRVPALITVVLDRDSPIFTNCLRSFKKSNIFFNTPKRQHNKNQCTKADKKHYTQKYK